MTGSGKTTDGSGIQVVRVLADPKQVSSLLVHPLFVSLVNAVRQRDVRLVKLISNTLEAPIEKGGGGYSIEVIAAAMERVAK